MYLWSIQSQFCIKLTTLHKSGQFNTELNKIDETDTTITLV